MKKVVALISAGVLMLGIVGCSSGAAPEPSKSQDPAQEQAATKAFDGSAFTDTGAGAMYVSTPGGSTEGGNVPEMAVPKDTMMTQIGIMTYDMDGSVCTIYVDGIENTTINAGDSAQTINLQGDALKQGVHVVELVKMDGETPTIYKKGEYKVV